MAQVQDPPSFPKLWPLSALKDVSKSLGESWAERDPWISNGKHLLHPRIDSTPCLPSLVTYFPELKIYLPSSCDFRNSFHTSVPACLAQNGVTSCHYLLVLLEHKQTRPKALAFLAWPIRMCCLLRLIRQYERLCPCPFSGSVSDSSTLFPDYHNGKWQRLFPSSPGYSRSRNWHRMHIEQVHPPGDSY